MDWRQIFNNISCCYFEGKHDSCSSASLLLKGCLEAEELNAQHYCKQRQNAGLQNCALEMPTVKDYFELLICISSDIIPHGCVKCALKYSHSKLILHFNLLTARVHSSVKFCF